MTTQVPRLRMFAGPNGSGKTTIKTIIRPELLGMYINPDDIEKNYERSLSLLLDAIRYTNRTYIFDNSGNKEIWVAEITDGKLLELKTNQFPHWFKKAVWDKI